MDPEARAPSQSKKGGVMCPLDMQDFALRGDPCRAGDLAIHPGEDINQPGYVRQTSGRWCNPRLIAEATSRISIAIARPWRTDLRFGNAVKCIATALRLVPPESLTKSTVLADENVQRRCA